MYRVGIIGTGVVGSALAGLLRKKGYAITGVFSKSGVSAAGLARDVACSLADRAEDIVPPADVVFLTTPDRELSRLADRLAGRCGDLSGKTFFHMSGAFPAEILISLRENGAAIGSLHPLQSFANVDVARDNLPGSFFGLQGDPKALQIAGQIVSDLEGKPFIIRKEDKLLYHMGAAVASNYLVSVIDLAVSLYQYIGMTPEGALEALLPLIRGTLSNIERLGPVAALTGPIARGDAETVQGHLKASEKLEPDLVDLYRSLGLYTVSVAAKKGTIDEDGAEKLKLILRKDGDC